MTLIYLSHLIIDLENFDCMHVTTWKQLWLNLPVKSKQMMQGLV